MVRAGEAALDAVLEEAGFAMVDPTVLYLSPIDALPRRRPG
jgi:hypothetical protein